MGAASPVLHPHETVWMVWQRLTDAMLAGPPRRETHGMGEALASSVLGAMITKYYSPSSLQTTEVDSSASAD